MYAAKTAIITLLSALPFLVTASPVDVTPVPRSPSANLAVVNLYSGSTCGGTAESFSITSGYVCHAVSGAKASILVTENGCTTTTWSGTNCQGSSLRIPGDKCKSVLYGSVSVQC